MAGRDLPGEKFALRGAGVGLEPRGRELFEAVAPAHDAGELVGLEELVHAAAQAVLVAVLAGAEIAVSGPDPAQRFAAELAGSPIHLAAIIGRAY